MTREEIKDWFEAKIRGSSAHFSTKHISRYFPEIYTEILSLTDFLDSNAKTTERVYCLVNNITEAQKCNHCKTNNVKFNDYNAGYRKCCCYACSYKSSARQEKSRATLLKKYGVDSPFKSQVIRDKIRKNNTVKYGADHHFKAGDSLEKCKKYNMAKYGVEYVCNLPHVRKKAQDALRKNAVQVNEKRRSTCMERYGYKSPLSNPETRKKLKESNMKMFGTPHNRQSHISLENLEKLDNYDWLFEQYNVNKKSCQKIADILGVTKRSVLNHLRDLGIVTRKEISVSCAERDILSYINMKCIKNTRSIVPPYEIDIYIPDYNLAIEFDGAYWHSYDRCESNEEINKHLLKTHTCYTKGITLFHIFENEWENDIKRSIWKSIIDNKLNRNTTALGINAVIIEIDDLKCKEFVNNNYMLEYQKCDINIALINDSEILAVACIDVANETYHITTMCAKIGVKVDLKRLIDYISLRYSTTSIKVYSDIRFQSFHDFTSLGLIYEEFLPPRPWYCNPRDNIVTLHANEYFLKNIVPVIKKDFDDNLSFDDNVFKCKYRRLWDCGAVIFKYK